MSQKLYRRIKGIGRGAMSYSRLWLAPDHLLLVVSTGFTESYRRFYFRDIQAFVVRKTRTGLFTGLFLLIAGLIIAAIIALNIDEPLDSAVFWIVMAAPGILVLFGIVHLAKLPSCEFYIRTGVQQERVGSIRTLGTANKLVERLRPHIYEAQASAANPATGEPS